MLSANASKKKIKIFSCDCKKALNHGAERLNLSYYENALLVCAGEKILLVEKMEKKSENHLCVFVVNNHWAFIETNQFVTMAE